MKSRPDGTNRERPNKGRIRATASSYGNAAVHKSTLCPPSNSHPTPHLMIPPQADTDPDPTTQIAWPSASSRHRHGSGSSSGASPESSTVRADNDDSPKKPSAPGRPPLSTWDLITLSISMAGAQIAFIRHQLRNAVLAEPWVIGAAHIAGLVGGSN